MLDALHKSIMASLGQTEANTENTVPDPEMMQSTEEHQEICTQEFAVMPVRELRKRRRVRYLATENRQERKDRTRGNHGSRRKSAVARGKVRHHARVAMRKSNIARKIRIQVNSESSKEFAADGMRKGPGCENGKNAGMLTHSHHRYHGSEKT
jgi:hypothetical protein